MNIEDLTKTQLLLLTLLVNFVTSIATGVLTVSLLDQAPPTVIQTVNRIVDHTIETVTTEVPVIRDGPSTAPSSEDLLTSAIAKQVARSVSILRSGSEEVVAGGVFISANRTILTVGELPGTVRVRFADGSVVEAKEVGNDGEVRRYAFAADATLPSAPSARLVPSTEVRQGQTAITRLANGSAATGIVGRVEEGTLYTDVPGIQSGAAVVNLSGDIIGVALDAGRLAGGERLEAVPLSQ